MVKKAAPKSFQSPRTRSKSGARSAVVTGDASSVTTTGSASTSSSKRPGPPDFCTISLARDIQRIGFTKFRARKGKALQHLLDLKPKVYGQTADPVRRQLGNKWDKWKEFNQDQWNSRVIVKLKIDPNDLDSSSGEDDSSVSTLDEEEFASAVPKEIATTKQKQSTPKKKKTKSTASTTTPKPVAVPSSKKKKLPSPVPEQPEPRFPFASTLPKKVLPKDMTKYRKLAIHGIFLLLWCSIMAR